MAEPGVLYVVFSMNCLPAGISGEVQGPGRWDDARRAPLAFATALDACGLKGDFFIAPEALKRLRSVAEELRSAGHGLGVLCHPRLSGYQACLGSYNFDRQREIVELARAVWSNELGEAPESFRGGFYSANDYTYHVLCLTGFRHGSCSLPGRLDNDQCSMWFRSYPFPHHTDPLDRSAAGTMEFYEVPVTSDFEAASYVSYETYTPPHLRVEEPELHNFGQNLVARHLGRMAEDRVAMKVVHVVTSNLVGYGAEDDPHVERVYNLCTMLRDVAAEHGQELRGVTIAELHGLADEAFGRARDEVLDQR